MIKICIALYFQSAEVEETLKRIQSHKGVVGVIVVNSEGNFCIFVLDIFLMI